MLLSFFVKPPVWSARALWVLVSRGACRAAPRELRSRLMSMRDGSPGVLYVIVCGAPAASSVDEFIRLVQDAGWLVRVIATPMGERFIDACPAGCAHRGPGADRVPDAR